MAPRRVAQSRWPLNRMNGQGALLRFAVVLAAVVLADACGDGTTEPSAPDPLVLTSVTVSPDTAKVGNRRPESEAPPFVDRWFPNRGQRLDDIRHTSVRGSRAFGATERVGL